MYKAVLLFKLLFMSFFTHSAAIELSTGVGTQYGGIGGQQLAIRLDESKYFVAIGFLGRLLAHNIKFLITHVILWVLISVGYWVFFVMTPIMLH
ncbi:hypothetical protein [Pseudoalteromonas luteoviolacea]|uniref:Uncharacterized protein n=1 Tax=Pseudoalteromonas luteoviolacea H33 TaxID=1365251 RepID=A0A161Y472_9GAMM|nr:hypothetical protein [Pseudoalteromonas luteoviolacea]KZN50046.1 hypothetical protein N476_17005 [Pseudoalteromonas luteoviolacea H33]KZN76380.1 hypothetical protein N477_16880 [Pseudoalteromonas luteoviolacea H33-S]